MFRNYITIAFRHLARHKLFSMINILCLAIGITFSMLIGVYIMKEKSVDRGIRNIENQYLVKSNWKVKDMGLAITTAAPLPRALKEEYPGLVANYYRINPVTNVVSAGNKHFKENIAICDTTLVSMYGFELLHGDPSQAFRNNSSAVITEEMAVKLFGTTHALGKTVSVTGTVGTRQDFLVSAVLKKLPAYSTVNNFIDREGYNIYVPFEGNQYYQGGGGAEAWGNISNVGMIELQPGVSPADLARPMAMLLSRNLPVNLKGLLVPELAPMKSYYLQDNGGAVKKMITTLSLVAVFILLMAIINFVNISIGTSSYRLKEIGLRKVFGSARSQLVMQHLSESLILTFIATLLSMVLYEGVRPVFMQLLHAELDAIWHFSWLQAGLLLAFVTGVGIIAGVYPAFVLSTSGITHAVKGKIDTARGGLVLRKSLLVVQFTLAIVIFISALNVSKQVSYVFSKDLGYKRDHLLVITVFPKQWDAQGVTRMESIKNGLMQLSSVTSAALSFEVPDRQPPMTMDLLPEGSDKPVVIPTIEVDEDFVDTYGLQVKEGSFFAKGSADYSQSIVLNETAAKILDLTGGEIKSVQVSGGPALQLKGVVKDFNYSSFQESIGPVAFLHLDNTKRYRYLSLKLQTADITATIADLKKKWNELSPNSPFEYVFMDDRFESLYRSELQLKKATKVATVLNLLIVFMGVFGIVAFTMVRRTKEIAVRKVLGAQAGNIIFLFVKEYVPLIFIANLLAWPFAYLATNYWLQNYAYRIQQDVTPYLQVGVFVFVATFVFIAAQCLKIALRNPVRSLRAD